MMRCVKPYLSGKAAFGCGQCMPCRFNRRRVWLHRMLLEASCYGDNSFVTLTYEKAPDELKVRDYQLWLKKLRKRVDKPIRYFVVGEYGDTTMRPHFHAALFNFAPCMVPEVSKKGDCPCPQCSVVRETWGFGHVMVGHLSAKSASYVAGYVTKKMTIAGDPRLGGRTPEFARMSLRPGIGVDALWDVASAMMRYDLGNVPSQLRVGPKLFPLGRYLRRRLGLFLGMSDEEFARVTQCSLQSAEAELQVVRKVAFAASRSVSSVFDEVNAPYARALEAREKVRRRSL